MKSLKLESHYNYPINNKVKIHASSINTFVSRTQTTAFGRCSRSVTPWLSLFSEIKLVAYADTFLNYKRVVGISFDRLGRGPLTGRLNTITKRTPSRWWFSKDGLHRAQLVLEHLKIVASHQKPSREKKAWQELTLEIDTFSWSTFGESISSVSFKGNSRSCATLVAIIFTLSWGVTTNFCWKCSL